MDDESTTTWGLFNTAEAYRLSAVALHDHPIKIGHAAKPVQFLYSHAIELYLKALLRQKHSADVIRDQFGHYIGKLLEEAETLGLVVRCEDRDVLAVMANTKVLFEMRYIKTGSKTSLETIELEKLRSTSINIRDRVVDALLRTGGTLVRRKGEAVELGPATGS